MRIRIPSQEQILKIKNNEWYIHKFRNSKTSKPYNNNNCPPGHYVSIQAEGNGHSVGDRCGYDGINPETTIDFIVPLLMLSALIIIIRKKINFKTLNYTFSITP